MNINYLPAPNVSSKRKASTGMPKLLARTLVSPIVCYEMLWKREREKERERARGGSLISNLIRYALRFNVRAFYARLSLSVLMLMH